MVRTHSQSDGDSESEYKSDIAFGILPMDFT